MKQPDDVKRDLVLQWLNIADEDYNVALHLFSSKTNYLNTMCYHAQQAAEKYLKAFLTHHQVEFRKTHDLGELLDLVATVNPQIADFLNQLTELNPYSVEYRYPGETQRVSIQEVEVALKLAEKVREKIKELVH